MQSNIQSSVSKGTLWGGRIMSWLPALFMLMDGVMKLFKPAIVVEATVKLGYPENVIVPIGIVLDSLHDPLFDSAHGGAWRDPVDRLSWRRCSYTRPRRREIVFDLVPDHFRHPALGWPLPAQSTVCANSYHCFRKEIDHEHCIVDPAGLARLNVSCLRVGRNSITRPHRWRQCRHRTR